MAATLLGLTITSFGWLVNLIIFLINEFNIKSIAAAKISSVVNGCLCMFPVVAAIVSDSFFGTIPVISSSAFISLAGIVLLTLTASIHSLRPRPCENTSSLCQSPSRLQLGILFTALSLTSIGTGGTRFTLAAAGANQYSKPKDQRSFFNWFFFTMYLGAVIGATAVVYVEDNISWRFGFGLCVAANLISFVVFISGKRFYKNDKPLGSPYASLLRVIVAATLKRQAAISSKEEDYHHEGGEKAMPSKSFRFLNRAAMKAGGDIEPDGSVCKPWRIATVQQVEDFKDVVRVLPLWSASILLSTPIAVLISLTVLQALVMDRQLGPHFKIPAGSLQVIILISTCVFLILNNWFLYPLYQKLTRKPLTLLQRIGIGHVLNILSMAVSAIVEAKRLKILQNHHVIGSSVAPMPVLCLFPPLVLAGICEAFSFPANVALCYQEFPESLKSTATSMTSVVIGISFYVSTALIDLIQRTTSWLPDDINHGRVDNVYWVLVIISVVNLCYFLVCAWFFRYKNLGDDNGQDDVSASTNFS
ncbi:PREDICTED: protein NRT1/ PTR FAMILY 2.7-like isoform X2 [Tarenaya hassleriana]|nr:PREDICTED: protein NRT1/ PTR FAMILY 2.7-like isoform X2 [Tarenaya hassleriana]